MTLQQEIALELSKLFPEAIVKKMDKDNYLDIHLPSVNEKKGTHIFFNTAGGNVKIGFYCRDEAFIEKALTLSNKIEHFSQGIRPKGNPAFRTTNEALTCAVDFILSITGNFIGSKTNNTKITPLEIDEEYIISICSAIREHKILPVFPFITDELKTRSIEISNIKNCFFYAENISIGDDDKNSYNLLVDHNGFHSSLDSDEFKIIFSWDSISEIKTKTKEDNSYTMIGLFQSDGRYLSLSQKNSSSLLILKYIYNYVMREIIMEFIDEPIISWSKVDEMGIKRISFNSYDDLYKLFE